MSDPRVLDRYDAFAVDLDGVIWRGGEMIERSPEALQAIISAGKRLLLLTNNGSYLPDRVAKTLNDAGAAVVADQVLTSSIVARSWIQDEGLGGRKAFVLGRPEIGAQIEDLVDVIPIEQGNQADLVLVARDTDLTYERLRVAANSVIAGAAFLALNNDPIMPVEDGYVPGTGAVLAAMEASTGHKAIVLGKPEAPMMKKGASILGEGRILMIGDRLEADIVGAKRIGWDAALVLSGLPTTTEMDPKPDYLADSIGNLIFG